jgi:hypothetical protein
MPVRPHTRACLHSLTRDVTTYYTLITIFDLHSFTDPFRSSTNDKGRPNVCLGVCLGVRRTADISLSLPLLSLPLAPT